MLCNLKILKKDETRNSPQDRFLVSPQPIFPTCQGCLESSTSLHHCVAATQLQQANMYRVFQNK